MFQDYLDYMFEKNHASNVENSQINKSQNHTKETQNKTNETQNKTNETRNKTNETQNKTNESHNETKESQNEQIKDLGQVMLDNNSSPYKIELLSIIGEVEGHESAPSQNKTTKYEHVLPKLALMEDNKEVDGLLILLNTVGGDVEAGLAIAEMIASLSIPTVSLVLGGGHSIGVPMAVSADYSFIVPSATMVIHPVRTSGMFIGVAQSYRNILKIQDRISSFVERHSKMSQKRFEELLLDNSQLVKDIGTMLDGEDAVREGLINEIGGMKDALRKLYELIEINKKERK